ncbi:cell cycle checkpoint control protein RAD9A isoform X2 [Amia ocellicauda]
MDCVVTAGNVKVLAKAIHSLSKIGEELYLEPLPDGLALRTVNSSRSAYACFFFSPLFFQKFVTTATTNFRCKTPVKSVQAVFRSLSSLDRTVERCEIQMSTQCNTLTFTLHCKHGLKKTHNLSFSDSESLQAIFDKDSCANQLRAQPRLLVDTVVHFPPSLEEVTMSVSDARVRFRNHMEEEAELGRTMLTELCLSAEEFDLFTVNQSVDITFCLKELRGLMAFAESSGLPVCVHFDLPGRPVVFSVSDSGVLEVNFVLATLSDEPHKSQRSSAPPPPAPVDEFLNDDMDSYMIAMETSVLDCDWPEQREQQQQWLPPPRGPSSHQQRGGERERERERESERESESDNEIQSDTERESGGPPNKKFRSLFFGSVLPTSSQATNQTMRSQEVLASDSEEEGQEVGSEAESTP